MHGEISKDVPRPSTSRPCAKYRRLGVIACICLLTLGVVGYGVVYPQVGSALAWRKMEKALADRSFDDARLQVERILEFQPSNGEARFMLARIHRRAGRIEMAREQLDQAGDAYWDGRRIDLERQLMKAQLGMIRSVEKSLKANLSANHVDAPLILEALVMGCLNVHAPREAFAWTSYWREHFPDDWQARYWRGISLESGARGDLAEAEYEQILAAGPDVEDVHFRLAQILLRKQRFADALDHYDECLLKKPGHADALLGRARCQRALVRTDETARTLEVLLSAHPDSAGGLLLRGQLELEQGKGEDALPWLRRAESLAATDLETLHALATALRTVRQDREAQEYEVRHKQVRQSLSRLDEITKEVTRGSDAIDLRVEAGSLLLRLGKPQEAAHWLVGAVMRDPSNRQAKESFQECLHQLGDRRLSAAYQMSLMSSEDQSPTK